MVILKKILFLKYKFFVRINFYFGIALVLTVLTKTRNGKGKYRVLALNKSIFSNDLDEIKKVNSDIQFLSFPRLLLSEIIRKNVDNFDQLNDASYHPLMDETIEQEKIYRSMQLVFKHLQWMLNFDAIFAGNYVYVSQQEFFRVAKESNIPIIVLYKEGGIMAAVNKSGLINKNLYANKRFIGNKILFYNQAIYHRMLEANIPGISQSNSEIVGIPRLDKYFRKRLDSIVTKSIMLFAFDPNVKAANFVQDVKLLKDYVRIGNEFMLNLVKFCTLNSDFTLTIKTKNDPKSVSQIWSLLRSENIIELPNNIRITTSVNPYKLIESSSFIASSLSTTLIEGLLMNKPILCPDFSKIGDKGFNDMFEDNPEVVNYIGSYADLVSVILKGYVKPIKSEDIENGLIPLIYSTDGKSSDRVINEIVKSIENTK